MNHARLTILGLTLFAVGCSEPLGPAESLEPQTASVASAQSAPTMAPEQGVVASATGAANRRFADREIVLTFGASLHADGRTTGSAYFRIIATDPDTWARVDVTCMSVSDGNTAWMGGTIVDSSVAAFIGTGFTFWSRDEGEGVDATDVVSVVHVNGAPGTSEAFCENQMPVFVDGEDMVLLPGRDVLHGNVNIRGD